MPKKATKPAATLSNADKAWHLRSLRKESRLLIGRLVHVHQEIIRLSPVKASPRKSGAA